MQIGQPLVSGAAAASLVAIALAGAPAARADVVFAGNTWHLNSDAALFNPNTLRLTPDVGGKVGSAFITTPYALNDTTSFRASFQFHITSAPNTTPGDGLAFIIQNDPRGVSAIGDGGSQIGFQAGATGTTTINPSLVIKFDTVSFGPPEHAAPYIGYRPIWATNNGGDTDPGSLDFSTPASVPTLVNTATDLYAWVDFNAADSRTLKLLINTSANFGTATTIFSIADFDPGIIGSTGYFGFSAGTGLFSSAHDIKNFNLTGLTAVPLPAAAWLLLSGLAGVGAMARRRRSDELRTIG